MGLESLAKDWQRQTALPLLACWFTLANRHVDEGCSMPSIVNCIVRIPLKGTGNNTIFNGRSKEVSHRVFVILCVVGVVATLFPDTVMASCFFELLYGIAGYLCHPLIGGMFSQCVVVDGLGGFRLHIFD